MRSRLPIARRQLKRLGVDTVMSLTRWLFPPSCIGCSEPLIGDRRWFCPACEIYVEPVLPPYCSICGLPFVDDSGISHVCGKCKTNRPAFDRAAAAGVYAGPLARAVINLKFNGRLDHADPLGQMIAAAFFFNGFDEEQYDVIVPVPLSLGRLMKRGYNQAEALAETAARFIKLPVKHRWLKKTRHCAPQASLPRNERWQNVTGAFSANSQGLRSKNILLIDDIMTTGATSSTAARALKQAGANRVGVLTVARTLLE